MDAMFERALSAPLVVYALTAKYHVPGPRSWTTPLVRPGFGSSSIWFRLLEFVL
ncbi:MAG: hypothetical protein V9E93_03810 [Steroidobacteraceae bacterium]